MKSFLLFRAAGFAALCGLLAWSAPLCAQTADLSSAQLTLAEDAARELAQSNWHNALDRAQKALQSAPENPTANLLAGTVRLNTGDALGALAAFKAAAKAAPSDSLALYGMGLAQLALDNRTDALARFQQAEREGGDKNCLALARQYLQWLQEGKATPAEGEILPEFAAADHALRGMTALSRSDALTVDYELNAALTHLTGDSLNQPDGLLMTFDAAHPLSSGMEIAPLLIANPPLAKQSPSLRGDVTLTPEGLTPEVGYVSYELDGQTLSLINTPPFAYGWDTRNATNGWHTLAIVFYDRSGQEIHRAEQRVQTRNLQAAAPMPSGQADRISELRATLWRGLILHPDRCACNYTLGAIKRGEGDDSAARLCFLRAVAIHPEYKDARRQLTHLGVGMGVPDGLWCGATNAKLVALTFDDGPKPGVTERLLATLKQENVIGTFFVVGKQAMLHPDLTKMISDAGMEIANHSYTHPNLTTLNSEGIAREMMQTQAAVLSITGQMPRYMRPPGGQWNGQVAKVVREWGLTPCFWTVDAYGAEVVGAKEINDFVLKRVRPGSIILMHNGKMSTVEALPTLIRTLRERGYTFITVSDIAQRLAASKELAHIGKLPAKGRHAE